MIQDFMINYWQNTKNMINFYVHPNPMEEKIMGSIFKKTYEGGQHGFDGRFRVAAYDLENQSRGKTRALVDTFDNVADALACAKEIIKVNRDHVPCLC